MTAADNFRTLTTGQNDELVRLFRASPIAADFTVCFDRAPDFFRFPDLTFDSYEYLGIYSDERLVGCVMNGQLTGWIDGDYRSFGYLGDARVDRRARGSRLAVEASIELLRRHSADQRLLLGLIKEGNHPATHLAQHGAPDDFEFRVLTGFEATNLILLRRARPPRATRVRTATVDDIPAMAAVMDRAFRGRLFAPRVTAESLERELRSRPGLGLEQYYLAERGGAIVGLVGAWDMGAFKRTVILRYSTVGKLLRTGYQAGRLLFRNAAPLPRAGDPFREVTITRMAIPDRDPEILRDLLAAVANDCQAGGYHMVHVGFVGDDPLKEATNDFFVQRFRSTLWVGWFHGTDGVRWTRDSDPYVDLAII